MAQVDIFGCWFSALGGDGEGIASPKNISGKRQKTLTTRVKVRLPVFFGRFEILFSDRSQLDKSPFSY